MGDGGKVHARDGRSFGLALGFDMGEGIKSWGWASEGLCSLAGVADGAFGLVLFKGRRSTSGV